MSKSASDGFGQAPQASIERLQSSDSDKLFSIPEDVFKTSNFDFGIATDFSVALDNSKFYDTLEPYPVSRDNLFPGFLSQDYQLNGLNSTGNLQIDYPDPFQGQHEIQVPYYHPIGAPEPMTQFVNPFDLTQSAATDTNIVDPLQGIHALKETEEVPKVRTNSGQLVAAIKGPDGDFLHPYNLKSLRREENEGDNGKSAGTVPEMQVSTYQSPQLYAPASMSTNTITDLSYAFPDNQSTDPIFDSGSESEYCDPGHSSKRRRISQNCDEGKDAKAKRAPLYQVQSPKVDKSRPWVRVNSATKGNTRTGKTNTYGDGPYRSTEHPLGPNPEWGASDGTHFRYNQWGELQGVSLKASQLLKFFYEHPFHNNPGPAKAPRKLVLWIQKMPGDSAKRVNTQHGLKCRVAECPAGIYKSRTINTGHYRVAFDEQWTTYGDTRSPMHVAGYAHLYCMERYFDFKALCRDLDLRADDRELPGEPTGEWIAGLGNGTEEYRTAKEFITMAKTGRYAERWQEYPCHNPHKPFARKLPHSSTLTHKLVEKKAAGTGHSKMRMMEARGRSATQFFVNMGDLQLQIDTQQERNSTRSALTRGRITQKRKMRRDSESEND